jgi:hypothetical protein
MKKITNNLFPHLLKLSYLYEPDLGLFAEEEFRRILDLETKRAARCGITFLLLLLDLGYFRGFTEEDRVIRKAASALFASTSEVDAKGWYRYPTVIGTLVTDIAGMGDYPLLMKNETMTRVHTNLAKNLNRSELERIVFSCYCFPVSQWSTAKVPPWLTTAQAV